MAYLTLDPTTDELAQKLMERADNMKRQLRIELPKLGVDPNDIVFKILRCSTTAVSEGHVEIILKTDNPRVTAPKVVEILAKVLEGIPFEVSRIPVGYWAVELTHELWAFLRQNRRNWASNYNQ